jgi:hypothetical protein
MAARRPAKISPTVRVHERTREQLRRLTSETGRSAPDLLADAVDLIEHDRILDAANEAFAALRSDPVAWEETLQERREWHDGEPDPGD